MQTIISKKQAFKIKKEEGWYSEDEMRNELGWGQYEPHSNLWDFIAFVAFASVQIVTANWKKKIGSSRSKVDGAKTRCLAIPDTHVRLGYLVWVDSSHLLGYKSNLD